MDSYYTEKDLTGDWGSQKVFDADIGCALDRYSEANYIITGGALGEAAEGQAAEGDALGEAAGESASALARRSVSFSSPDSRGSSPEATGQRAGVVWRCEARRTRTRDTWTSTEDSAGLAALLELDRRLEREQREPRASSRASQRDLRAREGKRVELGDGSADRSVLAGLACAGRA